MNDFDPNYQHVKTLAVVGQKAIILNSQGQLLLLRRSDKSSFSQKWSLAGGALEKGEEPFAGIRREIVEETQLEVKDLKPFTVHSFFSPSDDFAVVIGYICQAVTTEVVLNWEHDEFRWLSVEAALKLDLSENGKFFVEEYRKTV